MEEAQIIRDASKSKPEFVWRYSWAFSPICQFISIICYRQIKHVFKEENLGKDDSPILELSSGGWPRYKIYNKDKTQVCIDFDPVLIKRNKNVSEFFRNPFARHKREVHFIVGHNEMLPLRDDAFDTVVLVNALDTNEKELGRVLRNGGVIVDSDLIGASLFRKENGRNLVRVMGGGCLS